MDNVILVTWYKSINYGTCLQAYALYQKLQKMGYNVKISEKTDYKSIITIRDLFRRIRKKAGKALSSKSGKDARKIPKKMEEQYKIRREKMFGFSSDHMNIYRIKSKTDYIKMNCENDIFVIGSDQIWNPYYLSKVCLLSFVSDEKRKISYATSIGVNEIPKDLKKVYKKYISRFESVSVREESAAATLSEIVNRKINVVADPTFLLEKQDLRNLASENNAAAVAATDGEKFILCYFIGDNLEWVKYVSGLQKSTKCKVINVMTESHTVPNIGESFASFGISDFLWLIDNAEYICTDSFHCTALSINLERNFYAFKRFKDTDKNSQNSRLYSLLKTFGLEERLIGDQNIIVSKKGNNINYSLVSEKLRKIVADSERYLREALDYKEG
ncbi:polysaccharide pyruvyl transferase family protein [Ruminococcus flavefaciens]|uniref:polysaccharide pyruvyl transferase family protein n=1 Tax=Ruminococcus flavefaciens TaxID=1265 RepID=UPI0026F15D45|nr:polysaccharide pyruvyl transferase family protein [Ruminococcus flavefaciens]